MKVLWFANTPCRSVLTLDPNMVIGGWLNSLEEELVKSKKIELSICFYWKDDIKPFFENNVNYYPIYIPKNKRVLKRIFSKFNDLNEIKLLLNIVNIVKPDIIHIHGTEFNFGLLQKQVNIKSVVSLQGILSPYYEKYFSGIPKTDVIINEKFSSKLKLNSELNNFKRLSSAVQREKQILESSTNIIGRTDWDRRIAKILSPNSEYYVGNEIMRKPFYENCWSKNEFNSTLNVVTIMSGGLYKGLENIVKTLEILKNHSSKKICWKVIGQSENDYLALVVKKWLKVSYKNLNLQFLGKLKEDKLVSVLLESDVYCQVSHIENSPNSVCEAMLLGMPIIASFVGGTDSILEHNKEGILIQDGDPYSLAGTIIELSENFNLAIEYAKNARVRALERHNSKKIGNEYIEIYEGLLNG